MEESELKSQIELSFLKLKTYCEEENFMGWDPYDGLNSRVFQALPLKHWDLARLAWIQGFKRSPVNFRKLLLVPKEHNAKGIALFLSGYCNLYELTTKGKTSFGEEKAVFTKINYLANLLDEIKNTSFSGACWGYNFDWQARRLFFFPKNTPTVVATAFCASALFKAYEITRNETYLKIALSSANFVINDLSRSAHNSGFLFSYSPLDGNNTVYNASLLGAKILSQAYKYTKDNAYQELARKAVSAACESQQDDGSWVYGLLPVQSWKDSFHTGYNLESISVYQKITGDYDFSKNIEKGFQYYLREFFERDGTPKYYNTQRYPIDIHCPGQLVVTLSAIKKFKEHENITDQVLDWTIKNMQSSRGYFYYQIKKRFSSKIPFMRWSNAFMFNAMSVYLKEVENV